MNVVIYSQIYSQVLRKMYAFFLQNLLQGRIPVLIIGNHGFPFYEYIQYANSRHIPVHISGELQVASAVNMHHIAAIVESLQPSNYCPVILNLTELYNDDSLERKITHYLFRRDVNAFRKLPQDSIFFEIEKRRFLEQRRDYLDILTYNSDVFIYTNKIIKNLTGRKNHGDLDAYLLYDDRGSTKRMESLPPSAQSDGQSLF